jgi:hypothetical protein
VSEIAGGVVLEEIVAQVPARGRLAERCIGIEMIALRGSEALIALE